MRLLGQTKVAEVYDKLVELTQSQKGKKRIALTKEELCDMLGITTRISSAIEYVLEMLGYIRCRNTGGSGTTVIEIPDPTRKPTAGEIELASAVYAIYTDQFHENKFNDYSCSPNLVIYIYYIYLYSIESKKQEISPIIRITKDLKVDSDRYTYISNPKNFKRRQRPLLRNFAIVFEKHMPKIPNDSISSQSMTILRKFVNANSIQKVDNLCVPSNTSHSNEPNGHSECSSLQPLIKIVNVGNSGNEQMINVYVNTYSKVKLLTLMTTHIQQKCLPANIRPTDRTSYVNTGVDDFKFNTNAGIDDFYEDDEIINIDNGFRLPMSSQRKNDFSVSDENRVLIDKIRNVCPAISHMENDIYIANDEDDMLVIDRYKISRKGRQFYDLYRPVERFAQLRNRKDIEPKRKARHSHINLDRDLDNLLVTYDGLIDVLDEMTMSYLEWARKKPRIELHYDCLVNVLNFINRYVDIDAFIEDMNKFLNTGKIPPERSYKKVIDPRVWSKVLYDDTKYSYYSVLRQPFLTFAGQITDNSEKKHMAQVLSAEMRRTEWYKTLSHNEGQLYSEAVLWAAIAGVVFGYMPIGLGAAHVKKYLSSLRKIISNDNSWLMLATKLNDSKTRFSTMNAIIAAMSHLWRQLYNKQSKLYDTTTAIRKKYKGLERRYSDTERRLIRTVNNLLIRDHVYHEKLKQVFGTDEFHVSQLLSTHELYTLRANNIFYNGIMVSLLTHTLPVQLSVLSNMMDSITYGNIPVGVTLKDLSYFSFKKNIGTIAEISQCSINRLKYRDNWLDYQDDKFTVPWLLGAGNIDGSDKNFKTPAYWPLIATLCINSKCDTKTAVEVLRVTALILHHTNYRIWMITLCQLLARALEADLLAFKQSLMWTIGEYPPMYVSYHGIKIVMVLMAFIEGQLRNPISTIEKRVYDVLQEDGRFKGIFEKYNLHPIVLDLEPLPWDTWKKFKNLGGR